MISIKIFHKFSFRLLFFVGVLLINGCWTMKPAVIKDSGPIHPVDVSHIQDAVVKNEPKSRFGNPDYYEIAGKRYFVLSSAVGYTETGKGSWYGRKFHGRRTSSGEPYDMYAMTAAHKTLPLPTYLQVTNLENGKQVVVKVNDRGPFHGNRIVDLSYAAAVKLGYANKGTAELEIKALIPGVPEKAKHDGYLVQIGAYSSQQKAQALASQLERKINRVVEISAVQLPQKLLYRLRLGPFTNKTEANQWLSMILQQGHSTARLVTLSERWQNL